MKHSKPRTIKKRSFKNPTIQAWFDQGTLDRDIYSKGSTRGHKHDHNPAARPSGMLESNKKALSPAAFRRRSKAIRAAVKEQWLKRRREIMLGVGA